MDRSIKTKIVESKSNSPYTNLAIEEYLLNNVDNNEVILYLWQNENTIVIGRNQNPWRECKVELFESEGGTLVRRLSGGGTVYHDLGNLNFTFLMKKENYNLNKQLSVILNAVKSLGIEAEFKGRNDIVVNDRKFSGNAFYQGKNGKFHHGTILFDVDINKLQNYLQVSKDKIESKGIKSVSARVINIRELNPDITIDKLKTAMRKAFVGVYGGNDMAMDLSEITKNVDFIQIEEKYSSWDWNFGETPDFDINLEKRFEWGNIQLALNVENGIIVEAKVYSDSLEVELFEKLPSYLKGIQFDYKVISENLINANEFKDNVIMKDLVNWLLSKE